jgi:hypothetical protein
MKALTFFAIVVGFLVANRLPGQSNPGQLLDRQFIEMDNAMSRFIQDSSTYKREIVKSEWLAGLKNAAISGGGLALSYSLAVFGFSKYGMHLFGGEPDHPEYGPVILLGAAGVLTSFVAMPILVARGVTKAGQKYYPDSRNGQALAGALAGTAVSFGSLWLLSKVPFAFGGSLSIFSNLFRYEIVSLALVPLSSMLTYTLFNRRGPVSANTLSLMSVKNGRLSFGTPLPLVYRNPFMDGKMSTQLSLFSLQF